MKRVSHYITIEHTQRNLFQLISKKWYWSIIDTLLSLATHISFTSLTMSAQTSQAGSLQPANAVNPAQPFNATNLAAALQAVNNAWRMYFFQLENGTINDITVTPVQYRALCEPGLKAISNRYRCVLLISQKPHS